MLGFRRHLLAGHHPHQEPAGLRHVPLPRLDPQLRGGTGGRLQPGGGPLVEGLFGRPGLDPVVVVGRAIRAHPCGVDLAVADRLPDTLAPTAEQLEVIAALDPLDVRSKQLKGNPPGVREKTEVKA